jgi:hypothetical protein
MCWYRYNDPRYDGVLSPEELRGRAHNLCLRDLELWPVVRLDSLIHGWANHDPALAALVSAGGGRVWLQSKLPVPIVAGLSRVVDVVGEVCWTPLGSSPEGSEAEAELAILAAWLEGSGFQPAERGRVHEQSAAVSLIWRQDPLRRAVARREQLEKENAQLRDESQVREAELTALRAELEALRAEQEALRSHCEGLVSAKAGLEREQADQQAAWAAAAAEAAARLLPLEAELAALRAQLGGLQAEKEDWVALAGQRAQQIDQMAGTHEARVTDLEARLAAERQASARERLEMAEEIDAVMALLESAAASPIRQE